MLQGFNTDCFLLNKSDCKINLSDMADKRQIDHRFIKTNRGMIFDTNGEILAMSLPKKTLCINIFKITQLKYSANEYRELLKIINLSTNKFSNILDKYSDRKEYYLKRKLDEKLVQKIQKLNLPYVYFIDEYHRVYLGSSYFSNIIGFTDIDDNGQSGIEYIKNSELQSTVGLRKIRKDNLGRSVEIIKLIKDPIPGKNITLSIDKRIQFIGYKILKEHIKKSNADSGSLVLIRNQTGEIVSMVNYPSFNPSNRKEMKGRRIENQAITSTFEPGSTMKPFTIYSGIYTNKYLPHEYINTSKGFYMKDKAKQMNDYKDLGQLNAEGILMKSSNVGAATISTRTDRRVIYNVLSSLDFGKSLYMSWPGEQSGKLEHYDKWTYDQQATIGYGYGLSTTLLHLANAYVILANYGKKVQLSYEKKMQEDIYYEDVLDKNISKNIIQMMKSVVGNQGTAINAKLDKYSVAGKTGTVRVNMRGKYNIYKHNALFVGIVPASKPEYVAAIIVRNPKSENASGGRHAAPIFRDFMSHSMNLLKVYPDIR